MSTQTDRRHREHERDRAERAIANERRGLYFAGMAVLLFSTSPIFVRWAAQSLTSIEITTGRMLSAGVLVMGLALLLRQPLPARRDWPRFLLFGLIAALHFGFYIGSLSFTTITHSLALVHTAPIFVAFFSRIFLAEGLSRRQWLGTLVTVGGVALLAGFEPTLTSRMVTGDLLAVGSAICFGLYSVAGRSQRNHYELFVYAGATYTVAGLWLLPFAVFNFTQDGYTIEAVASILALGILPLGIGHTLFNAAVRRTRAIFVNLIATQEITGGVLLGVVLLQEIPSLNSVMGALITLAGIALVVI